MDDTGTGLNTVTQDQVPFLGYPSSRQDDPGHLQCLIYLIPGNPGLIAYYEPFMKTLRQLLDEKEAVAGCRHAFHIYGRNLLGFQDGDHSPAFGTTTTSGTKTEPFTLEDQIRDVSDHLQQLNTSTLKTGQTFDQVILIGHSVGAYITLELFHRHHHARRVLHTTPTTTSNPPPDPLGTVPLTAAILLFPTISHIARSRSGQKLDLLRTTPFLDRAAHHIAKRFVDLCPGWLLSAVVRRVMGFPAHAVGATLQFLASRDGIWQALHLGKDEMRVIGEERWGEEMWVVQEMVEEEAEEEEGEDEGGVRGREGGEGKAGLGRTKFIFYFAERDHWVADECRDEFIERRRRQEKGRARVVVDEGGVPHAFCIHHSEFVAEKVKGWIGDIAGL
ncbi:hypothetical protein C8A01DRAFT_34677 [Parachaetomium inaequale]|uniref:Lipid droplet-associated hydrolase n=1 Tax=Parachaetomium inaequale TaxID=2588326 RepID=A0AAN6PJT2_9PEZI|nr:hypothetical protein C8A01DRAFT_34677 [Parachaetomium inaequale]